MMTMMILSLLKKKKKQKKEEKKKKKKKKMMMMMMLLMMVTMTLILQRNQVTCEALDAKLVEIETAEENHYLAGLIHSYGGELLPV